jgi:DnaJ like chaperone protein
MSMNYQFVGKVIGGLIGLAAGGIVGLIVGALIGHAFDRALAKTLLFGSPENIERIRNSFFETTFLLSGFLAKVDGRISKQEIEHTEQVITQMGLNAQQRQRAIELFRTGSASDFNIEPVVAVFLQTCGPQRQLQQTLLLFLISLAHADRGLEPVEHAALVRIAGLMGMAAAQLEQLLRMARAQEHFQQQGGQATQSATSLEDAYAALGVDKSASDKEVKRAYRKRMSEHHPDKLIAKGVPEEMIKLATARAQEIQTAYEAIKKTRPAIR